MNSNKATQGRSSAASGSAATGAGTAAQEVSYLPGDSVAVVTSDSVLLVPRGDQDMAQLLGEVSNAEDARTVLIAAAGGSVLDLNNLPDIALAHRGPGGLRVLLSGRSRCTVEDEGTSIELDAAEVALLGEWGFPARATVELSVHDAVEGHPSWPVTGGVVPAGRVRWAADAAAAPRAAAVAEPEPTPVPAPTSADATIFPDATIDPVPDEVPAEAPVGAAPVPVPVPVPAATAPEPEPDPVPAPEQPVLPAPLAPEFAPAGLPETGDDGDFDDVSYTIGGGIDYDRVFSPASRPSAATSAFAPPVTPHDASVPPVAPVAPSAGAGAEVVPSLPETPAPEPHLPAPDLGGDTISPEAAAALKAGRGQDFSANVEGLADVGGVTGVETVARLCPQNHANPPQLSTCRLCQAPLDGETVRIERPSLGVVRLSTGMFFDLDRPLLIGRGPQVNGVAADLAPRLIVLPSPEKGISRDHLRVDIDGWSVHAVDLGSKNGTYLRRGAADEVRLMPDEPKMLMSGDVLVVDDVRIRFEDLP